MTLAELSAADDRRRARSRYRFSLVVLVIAAVVSGLLLWRDLRDDRPHAKVGSFVSTRSDIAPSWRRTVLVPGTRYDVAATVRDDVTQDVAAHGTQAPDGGVFVGLSISASARPGPFVADRDLFDVTGPRFVLVADGRRYALPSSESSGGLPSGVAEPTRLPATGWLAVVGEAGRLSLETSWQGRVQLLDLRSGDRRAGAFAALYRQRGVGTATAATTSCGTAVRTAGWRDGGGVAASCAYRADRLPWTKELGWAKPGRQWLAVTLTTTTPTSPVRRVGTRDLGYAGTGFADSSAGAREPADSPDRVDGRGPVFLRPVDADASSADTTVLVFDVASSSQRPTATFVVHPGLQPRGADYDSTDPGFVVTWTVPIGT